jgi:hypothetical protein
MIRAWLAMALSWLATLTAAGQESGPEIAPHAPPRPRCRSKDPEKVRRKNRIDALPAGSAVWSQRQRVEPREQATVKLAEFYP